MNKEKDALKINWFKTDLVLSIKETREFFGILSRTTESDVLKFDFLTLYYMKWVVKYGSGKNLDDLKFLDFGELALLGEILMRTIEAVRKDKEKIIAAGWKVDGAACTTVSMEITRLIGLLGLVTDEILANQRRKQSGIEIYPAENMDS